MKALAIMTPMLDAAGMVFPRPISAYPDAGSLGATLVARIHTEPFNAVATAIFVLAVLHTFLAAPITTRARRLREGIAAEVLHLLGEVEIVFGLWAAVLLMALWSYAGWDVA